MILIFVLLLKFAVLVCSPYVTQHARFVDFDMPSSCRGNHTGVLAMESDGTVWVIHNYGNGTYSLTWDEYWRQWESHRVEISEWKHAVNGTTVKGAVQISRPTDLITDNCYNEAIARYFSDRNGTMGQEPLKICPPNRSYCGNNPIVAQAIAKAVKVPIELHPPHTILIICSNDGTPARIHVCDLNCSIGQDKVGVSICQCIPNQRYCGHQINALGGWDEYDNHTVYTCVDGRSVRVNQKCDRCITTEQTPICSKNCKPNATYCGDSLLKMGFEGYNRSVIYRCSASGRSAFDIANCSETTCVQENSELVYCSCQPGRNYCFRELYTQMNWVHMANHYAKYPNGIWRCDNWGSSGSGTGYCDNCIGHHGDRDAYCEWLPGVFCGRALNELGWEGYENDTLYLCGQEARNASVISKCYDGPCRDNHPGKAYCPCKSGRIYCVHELFMKMSWSILADIYVTNPQAKMQCDSSGANGTNGIDMYNTFTCTTKCFEHQGDKDAHCQWTPGVFCGRFLHLLGWPGYENDTLYLCGEEPRNISIISQCQEGTCQMKQCSCIPNQVYCGHQLYRMGWKDESPEFQSGMSKCSQQNAPNSLMSLIFISNCDRCTSIGGHARCACITGDLYCGHELDGTPPNQDSAIYQCNGKRNATLIQTCRGVCARLARTPACLAECTPGELYCGMKLYLLGYTGYNNNSIYSCSADGQHLTDTGRVDALCTSCIPGRSYCGHQLHPMLHIRIEDLQNRIVCNGDGTSFQITAECTSCVNHGAGAYCQCVTGRQFCGREIYTKGWPGFGETAPLPSKFMNDTVFRCAHDDAIVVVEQCMEGDCTTWPAIGTSSCRNLCVPNRTYCGHEIQGGFDRIYPHFIYQCSESRNWGEPIMECGTCTSINGIPQCRHQCIPNIRYCGSDLIVFEGWDAMEWDSQTLYQCKNGSFASPEHNCTAGCKARKGDTDAYCLGMPVAWYWIFMATTLPVLFISLCLYLIRTVIKHRRLRNFVRQHRINASQLDPIRKLGHGAFGEVWKGTYTDIRGKKIDVALKISKHSLNSNPGMSLASANCFFQESVALDFLRHKNITTALGICSNYKMAGGITAPALVLEFINGGNSADYILAEREHLQLPDLMRIFVDICQAGEHLNKMGVVHRDIGARNILIHKNTRNGKPLVAKLTDFGLAKDVGRSTGVYRSTNAHFHNLYTAPEGFTGEFTSKSDVWSFAVFMWEIFMLMDESRTEAVVPYSDIPGDILTEIQNGYRLRRPQLAPTDVYAIMSSCWTWTPELRPTFHLLRKTFQSRRSRHMEEETDTSGDETGNVIEEAEALLLARRERATIETGYGNPLAQVPDQTGYGNPLGQAPESRIVGLVEVGVNDTPENSDNDGEQSSSL